MTTIALVLLLIAVVGLAVATTVGYVKGGLPVATPDVPPPLDGPVTEPADLDRARFGLALRGYRMDQVDIVLDGARDAMAERDAEIARLRRLLGTHTDAAPADEVDPDGVEADVAQADVAQADEVVADRGVSEADVAEADEAESDVVEAHPVEAEVTGDDDAESADDQRAARV